MQKTRISSCIRRIELTAGGAANFGSFHIMLPLLFTPCQCITLCYTNGMADLIFEWDEKKNKLNRKLHGISFEDAKFVFNDPLKIILPDLYHSDKEERWLAIGFVSRVLFVVFAERNENNIRIISARIATKAEERLYNDQNSHI